MVKFSALPCTIVRIIVVPVFFFIANYTEGKNHRADVYRPDHRPHERSEKRRGDSANTTTRDPMTLMNFDGPVISQDAESFEDDGSTNSQHIRVKRGPWDYDKLGKIYDEDFRLREEASLFKDDGESDVKNELADVYPHLIDDPHDPSPAVQSMRRKRLNYEMLFPRSYSKSESGSSSVNAGREVHDDRERSDESNGERDRVSERNNSDPKYNSSPVFFESLSRYENSLHGSSLRNPQELSGSYPRSELKSKVSELNTDALDSSSSSTNLTVPENGEITDPVANGTGDTLYSKSRKKKYTRFRGTRKGGPTLSGKGRKPRHRKGHKKKRKKWKIPAARTHEERSAAEIYAAPLTNGDSQLHDEYDASNKRAASRLVGELRVEAHVEKRDSGDAKSEIDINKREITADHGGNNETQLSRSKRTIENEKKSTTSGKSNDEETPVGEHADDCRRARCGNEEWRYYDDVYEPADPRTRRDYIETKSDSVDEARKERAAMSVRQIKKLMEKLTGKVNELETYVSRITDNGQERKKRGKKIAKVEDSSNWTRSVEGADVGNSTKDRVESRVCADETDAGSKLEVETSGRGDETSEKAAGRQTEEKRSTRTLRRRQTSNKSRIKKRKSHRKWDRWTDWSSCSVTCGKGRQIRWRHCIHDCTSAETEMEEKSCQLPACPPGKFLGIF